MRALGYPNLITHMAASITGPGWGVATPAAHAASEDRAFVARSVDASPANTVLDIDLQAAATWQALAIVTHNLSAAATVQLTAGTTAGDDSLADSGAQAAWPFTPLVRSGRTHNVIVVLPSPVTARYARISINDAANADGYVELAMLGLWALWVPQMGAALGGTNGLQSQSAVERSPRAALMRNRQRVLRQEDFELGGLQPAEAAVLHEMQRCADTTGLWLYVPHLHNRAEQQRLGMVCTARELTPVERRHRRLHGVAMRLIEY